MEKLEAKLKLIKNQLEIFQRRRKNISCVENCAGTHLAENLLNILENVDEGTEEFESESGARAGTSTFQMQPCVVQKAMSNSVVVRTILSLMSTRTLLECRKVSRLWREEATFILVPRAGHAPEQDHNPAEAHPPVPLFHVKFEKLRHFDNFSQAAGPLPLFLEILQHSTVFPCPHFNFTGGRMKDPNFLKFFSHHGKHVQHLKLAPDVVDLVTFRQILLKWTPNLKSLTFQPKSWAKGSYNLLENEENQLLAPGEKNPNDPNDPKDPNLSEALSLPKLNLLVLPKTKAASGVGDDDLDFPPGAGLIYEILTCAQNLTSIVDPRLSYIPQIQAAGKLSLMKFFRWSFLDAGLDQNFHRFVQAGPQVKYLMLGHVKSIQDPTIPQAASSLIHQSQGTIGKIFDLQTYSLKHLFNKTVALAPEFPQLPKVTHLRVIAAQGYIFKILPNQPLDQVFPHLKSLHVKMQTSAAFDRPPSPLCAHGLLEKLKIEDHAEFQYDWVQPMHQLYPNISTLHIFFSDQGLPQIQEGLAEIPQVFSQLEHLYIQINIEHQLPPHFKSMMDQALTGLPWHIFERLWSRLDSDPDSDFQQVETLDRIRISRSIFDLKKLKKLTFEIRFKTCAKPLWTHVAQFYAFQPMVKRQGLEVYVRGFQSTDVPLMRSDLGPISL